MRAPSPTYGRALGILLVLGLVTACGRDPIAPTRVAGVYALVSVNAVSLPAPLWTIGVTDGSTTWRETTYVVSDTIVLDGLGSFVRHVQTLRVETDRETPFAYTIRGQYELRGDSVAFVGPGFYACAVIEHGMRCSEIEYADELIYQRGSTAAP